MDVYMIKHETKHLFFLIKIKTLKFFHLTTDQYQIIFLNFPLKLLKISQKVKKLILIFIMIFMEY